MNIPQNEQLAEIFDLLAKYRANDGERFKSLAYTKASNIIKAQTVPITGDEKITGFGEAITGKIKEYLTTGKVALLEEYKAKIPPGVFELTKLVGIGPKKAIKLSQDYDIKSLAELKSALDSGKIVDEKLKGAFKLLEDDRRVPYQEIYPVVLPILEDIRAWTGVLRATFAGSMRRQKATIGDVDIIVATNDPAPIHARFSKQEGASIQSGVVKSSSFVEAGGRHYRVDLMTIPPDTYGIAMNYFTGSLSFNISMRILCKERGWKLNEYGVWDERGEGKRLDKPGLEDSYLFELLGIEYIPPEKREGSFMGKTNANAIFAE